MDGMDCFENRGTRCFSGGRLAERCVGVEGPSARTASDQRVESVETRGEHERIEDASAAARRRRGPGRRSDKNRTHRVDRTLRVGRKTLSVRPLRSFAHVQNTR